MDRGVPGDAPYLGRGVIYVTETGDAIAAIVTEVYPDGWTVDLVGFQLENGHATLAAGQLVPYGGNTGEFGGLQAGSWTTPDAYEGAKIYGEES